MKKTLKLLGIVALVAVIIFSMAGCSDGSDNDNKGGPPTFTVTFNADGGSPAPPKQTVAKGGKVDEPPAMTKTDHVFDGWFKEAAFTNLWDFTADTVTGNITLYAKWHPGHTVTFNADNGTANTTQDVAKGGKATKPADPTKASSLTAGLWTGTPSSTTYTFVEWQKDGAAYAFDAIVTADITLIAAWTATVPSPIDLSSTSGANIIAKSVAYIGTASGTDYTLVLDEDVDNVAAITHNKNGVTLTITSMGETPVVISKGGSGALLTVRDGATLVIDGNVTLQGISGNNSPVVSVEANGNLELKGNAKITGNTSSNSGSGVAATGTISGGLATVTMSGNAEISGNTSTHSSNGGGGVHLVNYANLTMEGNAAIKNNTVSSTGDAIGGGVTIATNSTFTMNGGEISGNNATATGTGAARGGGVFLFNANTIRFIVASEAVKRNIKNNTVTASGTAAGAQVYEWHNSVFEVDGVAQSPGNPQGYDSWD